MNYISCKKCSEKVLKTGPKQLYCKKCQVIRKKERGLNWYHKTKEENREKKNKASRLQQSEKWNKIRKNGKLKSKKNRLSFGYDPVYLDWMVAVKIPYNQALSKNSGLATNRWGGVYRKPEARKAREDLTRLIKVAYQRSEAQVVNGKLWLSIMVERPNMKSDPVNMVDNVCDALKEAIPLDDRWYCIKRLDWSVVKEDPHIYLSFGQESTEPVQICSYCGSLKSFSEYKKNKRAKLGVGRECKDCINQK